MQTLRFCLNEGQERKPAHGNKATNVRRPGRHGGVADWGSRKGASRARTVSCPGRAGTAEPPTCSSGASAPGTPRHNARVKGNENTHPRHTRHRGQGSTRGNTACGSGRGSRDPTLCWREHGTRTTLGALATPASSLAERSARPSPRASTLSSVRSVCPVGLTLLAELRDETASLGLLVAPCMAWHHHM